MGTSCTKEDGQETVAVNNLQPVSRGRRSERYRRSSAPTATRQADDFDDIRGRDGSHSPSRRRTSAPSPPEDASISEDQFDPAQDLDINDYAAVSPGAGGKMSSRNMSASDVHSKGVALGSRIDSDFHWSNGSAIRSAAGADPDPDPGEVIAGGEASQIGTEDVGNGVLHFDVTQRKSRTAAANGRPTLRCVTADDGTLQLQGGPPLPPPGSKPFMMEWLDDQLAVRVKRKAANPTTVANGGNTIGSYSVSSTRGITMEAMSASIAEAADRAADDTADPPLPSNAGGDTESPGNSGTQVPVKTQLAVQNELIRARLAQARLLSDVASSPSPQPDHPKRSPGSPRSSVRRKVEPPQPSRSSM